MKRLLPLLLLAACTVGPDFQPPQVQAPPLWPPTRPDIPGQTSDAEPDPTWWRTFHDPTLDSLVARLVAQNIDLQEAAERILQGRAQRQVAASAGLPHIETQSQYRHERQSPNGFVSLVEPRPGAPLEYDTYQNGLNASWELDLFGRVRRAVEAADAQTLASVAARRGIALAALAELAQDYLQLRAVQARQAIAERTLQLTAQNLRLVQDRFANGVATTLDTAQAQAQRATIAATLAPLRIQQAALVNAIGLLLAQPPRALEPELRPPASLPRLPAIVPTGLPATLVRRRPDVQEAEARLHAATAETGVATAQFYPDISLSGTFNLNGLAFANAFSLPSRAFDVGPTISLPLFEGGRLRGQLRIRQSQQREAALAWRRTVLQAWQEVDNALTAYAETQARLRDVAEAARQNQAALDAARQRYREGAADFLNVVAAQMQLLDAQNQVTTTRADLALGLVTLYRALGGGWQATEQTP